MALWKGRFRKGLDLRAIAFSSSLSFDQRLFREDIMGSDAHVAMLAKQKIISTSDAKKIQKALREIEKEIVGGKLSLDRKRKDGRFIAEDIHMAIEQRLIEKVGPVGGKLHTARSRTSPINTTS